MADFAKLQPYPTAPPARGLFMQKCMILIGFMGRTTRLTNMARVGRPVGAGEDQIRAVIVVETSDCGFDSHVPRRPAPDRGARPTKWRWPGRRRRPDGRRSIRGGRLGGNAGMGMACHGSRTKAPADGRA